MPAWLVWSNALELQYTGAHYVQIERPPVDDAPPCPEIQADAACCTEALVYESMDESGTTGPS